MGDNMAKVRISIVEYLNTAPLVWGFTNGPLRERYHLSFTVPSLCAEALHSGQADIAIIPAIEYQRMEGVVALPAMAIAAKGEVRSIVVIAKKPIGQARRVALDRSSRSATALGRLLCAGRWATSPRPESTAWRASWKSLRTLRSNSACRRWRSNATCARISIFHWMRRTAPGWNCISSDAPKPG